MLNKDDLRAGNFVFAPGNIIVRLNVLETIAYYNNSDGIFQGVDYTKLNGIPLKSKFGSFLLGNSKGLEIDLLLLLERKEKYFFHLYQNAIYFCQGCEELKFNNSLNLKGDILIIP
jgi:hypothetical protein